MGALHHSPATITKGIKRLTQFFAPDVYDIIVILIFGLLTGIFSLVVPIGVNSLVSTVSFGTLIQPLVMLMMIVMAGLSFAALLRLLQLYAVEILQRRLFVRLSLKLSDLLPQFKLAIFREQHGPELVNRFLEIVTIQKITSSMLLEGVTIVFQTVLGLLLLSFYHPYLLAFGILLIFSLLLIGILGWGAVPSAVDESVMKYRILAWLEELARHPVLYKSKEGRGLAATRTDDLCREYVEARYRHFGIVFRQHCGALFTQIIGNGTLLALGGLLVIRQELSLGQLVAAELVVSALLGGFAKLGKHLSDFYDLLASVDKLDYILEMPKEEFPGVNELTASGPLRIQFNDVSFEFGAHKRVINHVSLVLEPGAKVSIFGDNGSGKSCFANLFYKLETPTTGYILINDLDIRDISSESLRGHVSLLRGIELLPGTIADNLRVNKPDVPDQSINAALRKVGLFERVMKFPLGINTPMNSGDASLSRGELLLLMLARVIIAQPRLLVLDETLDGVDPGSLEIVYGILLDPNAPWTLVDFTHDSLVWEKFCNHYLLNNGTLVKQMDKK